MTGLWGRTGLAHAPSRSRIVILIAIIFAGYSTAMLINSVASRFTTPRFPLPPRTRGVDPLSGVGLAVHVLDPIFLIGLFRAIVAGLLCAALAYAGRAPAAAPALTDPHVLRAVVAGFFNAGGYATYLALTSRGGVSVYCALVGLYVCGPVSYGIFVRGEARTQRKLLGIGICVVAGVVLGYSEGQVEDSGVSPWADFLLFLLTLVMWSICDSIASFVGRDLDVFYVAGASGVGFAIAAFIAATVSFAVTSGGAVAAAVAAAAAAGGASTASPGLSSGGALVLLFFAQVCGVGAWFAVVELGKLSEASSFIPLTSLYTVFSSILSALLFGETPSKLYYVGLPLAAIGIGLLAGIGEQAGGKVELVEDVEGAGAVTGAGADVARVGSIGETVEAAAGAR